MKHLATLLLALLLLTGIETFAQRIPYTPFYDGLTTYSSGGYTPLVRNRTTHAMELLDTTGYQTFSNTVFGLKGIGYYAKYSRRNKVVSYIGVGANQGGEITLYDSAGNNYFRNFDSAGYRNIDSYRPVQISSRGVSAAKIDTFKQFTFDTTIKLSVVPTGDSSSDNLLAWNSTSKQVVKWAPITVTSVTANGNASATTFTLTVPSGRLFCIATSQNNVSTVQNCAISGTTLTVTTTAAPASGTNNVKFTILYR